VYLCVRLCTLSRSHFLIDFHQNWHKRKNPQKWKRVRWVSTSHHPFPHFAPENFLLKIYANINNPTSSLDVKFSRLYRNRVRIKRRWRQILDRKQKYGRFAHAQWKNMQYNPYLMTESPKFLWEQFGHCGLDYGPDITFHRTYV